MYSDEKNIIQKGCTSTASSSQGPSVTDYTEVRQVNVNDVDSDTSYYEELTGNSYQLFVKTRRGW